MKGRCITVLFSYGNCDFRPPKFHDDIGTVTLESVSGSVVTIPKAYGNKRVNRVCIKESDKKLDWQYSDPTPDEFEFYSVEEIRIPKAVKSIKVNRRIFPNLKRVLVEKQNMLYKAFDDYLVTTNLNSGFSLIAYYGDSEEFIIPDNVVSVGEFAFSFTNLRSIVFPRNFVCDSIESFLHSRWLENFDSVVEVNGVVLAFRKEIEEFVITDLKKLCKSTFQCAVPKKVVLDLESLDFSALVPPTEGFYCVALRNFKIVVDSYLKEFLEASECIIVNPDNEHYYSIDGTLFTKNKTRLLAYPQYKKTASIRC